jgi:hypothetical protein
MRGLHCQKADLTPLWRVLPARFGELGGTVLPGSPAEFGKLIGDEIEKWSRVISAVNFKAE